MGCAARLRELVPDVMINCFALARTEKAHLEAFEHILRPDLETITCAEDGSDCRRR